MQQCAITTRNIMQMNLMLTVISAMKITTAFQRASVTETLWFVPGPVMQRAATVTLAFKAAVHVCLG